MVAVGGETQLLAEESLTFSRKERDPSGNPLGFLLGVGRWVWGPPRGRWNPSPGCSMGQSHVDHASAPAGRQQCGGGWIDPEHALDPARGNHTCHLSPSPSSRTHVPSVQPHSRVPIPSPAAVAQKGEVSPLASPHRSPGAILGSEKSRRSTGRAMPCGTQGMAVDRKEEQPDRPVPPAPARGTGKEDPSHLKHKRGFGGHPWG